MGKSSKKSASKVDVAPAVAVPKLKSGKKGKREAEEVIEKLASAKKQKMEVKTQIKKKKEESSSSEEESSSDSEEEQQVKVTIKKGAIPAKPTIAESSGDETSSDDEPAVKVAVPSKKLPQAVSRNGTAGTPAKKVKQASSSDSSSDSAKDEPAIPLSAGKPSIKATETENSSEESSDESSDDEPSKKQPVKKIPAQVPVESSSEDEEEESEEQPSKTPKKTDTDVEMIDATSPKTNTKQLRTPATQSTGSKTVFVGNLPFDVEQDDVINFFKDAGEVIDMRVGFFDDGRPKGFCHVEFATAEEAQKALKLNDGSLMGRRLRLNMANERGSHTPNTGKESNSFQKDGKGQSQTVFVRGFDNSVGEEEIRSSLLAHFSSCGEISGQAIRIPVDRETQSVKGIAYLQFNDADSFSKALELNGSELGEGYLTVEEAKPRGDNRDGGDSGRGGWRGSGGRFGGRGGRGRGGRDGRGRGGRDGGRFGSRGRGRGPSMFAAGAGKKTTFND